MVPRDRTGLWSLPVDAGLRQTDLTFSKPEWTWSNESGR